MGVYPPGESLRKRILLSLSGGNSHGGAGSHSPGGFAGRCTLATVRCMRTSTSDTTASARRGFAHWLRSVVAGHRVDLFLLFVALVLFAVAWPTFFETHSIWPVLVPFVSALATWPVAVARHVPFTAWAAVFIACLVVVPFHDNPGFALGWPVTSHLALALTLAAVILLCSSRYIVWAVVATTLLMALNPGFDVKLGWILGTATFSAVVFLVRWLLMSRRQLATSHVELARESARSSELADQRILAEERNRLARDLHDVVAHQMSMIVVQAQSAPYRLQGVTPGIHAEFDSLSNTARSALDEVRGLLGVLRSDAEFRETIPVGADQLIPTLESARQSGVDITWHTSGELELLDETAGVVLHRVLQESLSNATRHAPGGPVVVSVEVDSGRADEDDRVAATLKVDNGPAVAGAVIDPGTGGGTGLQGMSARIQAVGGSFAAVPAADGGFTVTATVPVRGPRR